MQFLSKMLGFWGGGMIGGGMMGPNFMLTVNDLHILASSLSFMRERLSSFNASDWNKVFLINIFNRWFQHNPRSFQGSNPAYDFLLKLQDAVNVKHSLPQNTAHPRRSNYRSDEIHSKKVNQLKLGMSSLLSEKGDCPRKTLSYN